MQMNAGLILAGQQPDIMGQFGRGMQIGQAQQEMQRQNALAGYLGQHGGAIMGGDQNALAGLAGLGPEGLNAAMGVQNQQSQQEDRAARLELAYSQANQNAQKFAMEMNAAQRQQEAQTLDRALAMGTQAQTPEQWDQVMQSLGASEYMGQFESRDVLIAGALGVKDALAMGEQQGFRQASPEEAAQYGAAHGQFGPDGRFHPVNPPSGMTMETGPDGTFRFAQGAGVGGGGMPGAGTAAQGYRNVPDPNDPQGFRQEAIPGGPADLEQRSANEQERRRIMQARQAAGTVTQDLGIGIQGLEGMEGGLAAMDNVLGGLIQQGRSSLPRTVEHRIATFVESALNNVGFNQLQQMRENSPTGGALGNVTERQLDALRSVLGLWQPGLSLDDQRFILQRISNIYMEVMVGAPEERAEAVREGRMSLAEARAYDEFLYPDTRDMLGREMEAPQHRSVDNFLEGLPAEQSGGVAPPQAMAISDAARNSPALQSAAERNGVSIEEMWEFLSPEARQRFGG